LEEEVFKKGCDRAYVRRDHALEEAKAAETSHHSKEQDPSESRFSKAARNRFLLNISSPPFQASACTIRAAGDEGPQKTVNVTSLFFFRLALLDESLLML
jgi:hypothetical protein